jgi:hypothetical protein
LFRTVEAFLSGYPCTVFLRYIYDSNINVS